KYRAAFLYERSARSPGGRGTDDVTQALYSLVGFGTQGLRGRLQTDDEAFVFYGGQMSPRVPTAIGLQQVLSGYLSQSVEVQQFQGQWLYLDMADRSATAGRDFPDGQNMQLGLDAVVGERVWSVESKLRIRIGPVDYSAFRRYLPSSPTFVALSQLIRTYIGPEYDFDLQVILDRRQVPHTELTEASDARLGWNTWTFSADYPQDADQPLFEHDGNPCPPTHAGNTT
ncbi:MAG: type VI secretion system baseplate subunit TssG, partial [Planctomycetaceae bacterium]